MEHRRASPTTSNSEVPKKRGRSITSLVCADGTIVEMLYRPAVQKTLFCVARKGEVLEEREALKLSGEVLAPYAANNNLLRHEVILFPTEAADYASDRELVEDIRQFIHRFVDVSPLFEEVASYYVLFSWIHDSFDELPYLRVRGDTGSGKTRCLLTVGSLCYKPIFASGASTVSPIFRMLDSVRGTLIVDEADFRFSDAQAEIVKILNNGNARGFPVLRTESANGKEFDPRAYAVFGPKLIASRKHFQDRALETRCITEETGRQRLRQDIPLNLGQEWKDAAQALRNKLLTYRIRNFGNKHLDPSSVDRSIEPRLAQLFGPLLTVVESDEARNKLLALAREYHNELVVDRGMDTEAHLLEVVRDLMDRASGASISIKEIATEFSKRHEFDYERRITPRWIGGLLRRNLQFKTHKSNGVYVLKPIEPARLARLHEQYGIDPAQPGDDAGQTVGM